VGRKSHYQEHRAEALHLIERSWQTKVTAPTVRDLAAQTHVGLATMHLYLGRMYEEGLIEWQPGSRRAKTLKVSSSGRQLLSLRVP
jgi:DNA-binding MarR family transcriptional regulator